MMSTLCVYVCVYVCGGGGERGTNEGKKRIH